MKQQFVCARSRLSACAHSAHLSRRDAQRVCEPRHTRRSWAAPTSPSLPRHRSPPRPSASTPPHARRVPRARQPRRRARAAATPSCARACRACRAVAPVASSRHDAVAPAAMHHAPSRACAYRAACCRRVRLPPSRAPRRRSDAPSRLRCTPAPRVARRRARRRARARFRRVCAALSHARACRAQDRLSRRRPASAARSLLCRGAATSRARCRGDVHARLAARHVAAATSRSPASEAATPARTRAEAIALAICRLLEVVMTVHASCGDALTCLPTIAPRRRRLSRRTPRTPRRRASLLSGDAANAAATAPVAEHTLCSHCRRRVPADPAAHWHVGSPNVGCHKDSKPPSASVQETVKQKHQSRAFLLSKSSKSGILL